MALSCNSEFIFIGKGDESFLENYSYEGLFMALEILNNQAEAEDLGEAIFSNFKQAYYADADGEADAFERFEAALKQVNATIESLKDEKVSRFIGNLNIAVGAIENDTLHIATTGDAEVYLVRKRFVSVVSEGLAEDSKNETFVNIANGTLEHGDRVVIASSRLLRYITKGELGKIFSDHRDVGAALTELQDFVMTEILGRSSVVGVALEAAPEEATASAEEEGGMFEEKAGFGSLLSGMLGKIPRPKFLSGFSLSGRFSWLSGLAEKARAALPKNLKERLPEPKLPKIHFHERMSKERILLTAVVLLVALVSGIFWIRTRGNQQRAIDEQQVKLNHSRELVNDALTVGQFDKPKAAELLAAAESQALEVLNSRLLRGEAVKMLDDIQANRDNIDEVKRITQPTLLADFSEKRPNVSALGLLALKDKLFGFEYNALYEMVLDKLQEPQTISDLETVILGTNFEDQNALLFLTRTGKLIQLKDGRFTFLSTKDGIWKKGVDMKTYHDRLYVLDPERNQIWRYTKSRDGFEVGEGYNEDADVKTGVSIAIDSSVYVLHSDGTVTQLYQGQKKEYPLRRPPLNALVAPTKLFTDADLGHLYVLEPGKNRVVLFKKDLQNGGAQYQTQYVFEKTGVLRDFAVSDNRLYVMDDKRVYFVNLSGL